MVIQKACYMKTRRYKNNRLLKRKQFIVDVYHPGCAPLTKMQIRDKLKAQFNIANKQRIVVYGLRNKFGGGKQAAYVLIYDNVQSQKRYEPKYRLIRQGLMRSNPTAVNRAARKQRKRKGLRKRGIERSRVLHPHLFRKRS